MHWLTAALVFTTLFVGFVMVNSVSQYAGLVTLHKTLGALILLLVVLARVINRLTHHPPAWPATIGALEGKVVVLSELSMYAMLLVQPLLGWAMVSAARGASGHARLASASPDQHSSMRSCFGFCAKLIRWWPICCWRRSLRVGGAAAYLGVARPTDRADDVQVEPTGPAEQKTVASLAQTTARPA